MNEIQFSHHGFKFKVDPAALEVLVLSHLVGRDMRSVEQLIHKLPMDLLRESAPCLDPVLANGIESFTVRLSLSDALSQRLESSLAEVVAPVVLVTKSAAVEDMVRRLLAEHVRDLEVVPDLISARSARGGRLVVVDQLDLRAASQSGAAQQSIPILDGFDGDQVAILIAMHGPTGATSEQIGIQIPVRMKDKGGDPKGLPQRQGEAKQALLGALHRVRFARLVDRATTMHMRWKTHHSFAFLQEEQVLRASIEFEGEERFMATSDLKMDIGWSELPAARLADVSGHHEAKAAAREALDWMKDPRGDPGIRGFVVDGPPGTGKSLFCAALAGEAQAPCFLASGSEFHNMWWGETERRIREMFRALSAYDTAVVVIDEFDALAWRRDATSEHTASSHASIIGELLTSFDRLRQGPGKVLFLATTNQYHRLDPAIVRSMRIGDRLHLDHPSDEEREELLCSKVGDALPMDVLKGIVDATSGVSQADLVHVCDRASTQASREGRPLRSEDLRGAILALRGGPKSEVIALSDGARRQLAYHEAGHAVAAFLLLGPECVSHLTIEQSEVGMLGGMFYSTAQIRQLPNETAIRNRIKVALAGRASEMILDPGSGPTVGAADDLSFATDLAQSAVGKWGLDSEFPLLAVESLPTMAQHLLGHSLLERTADWVRQGDTEVHDLLASHWIAVSAVAERLIEMGILHRPEIASIMEESTSLMNRMMN